MATFMMRYFLLFQVLALIFPLQEGTIIDAVGSMTWDGIAMYIPVSKDKVQQKLDEYQHSLVGQCNRKYSLNCLYTICTN